MKQSLRGIFPALVTPFDPENRVSAHAVHALVESCIAQGVSGFYVNGSTAECFLMTLEERKAALAAVIDANAGRKTIIAHVGAIATDHAVELARFAADSGADYVSSIPPFYYKFTLDQIKDYYRDIASSVPLPMILYNFPAFSGVTLDADTARDLLEDPRFAGVNHTSPDMYGLNRLKLEYPRISVLNGHDEVYLASLSMGADGAIGSTYNFMGDKFVRITAAFEAGRMDEARKLQEQADRIIRVLLRIGVFAGVKFALKRAGIDAGPCRRPFTPLDAEGERLLSEVLEENL